MGRDDERRAVTLTLEHPLASSRVLLNTWAILIYLAMARLAAFLLEISAATVAQSGLVVAAATGIGAFLVYDRE